MVGMAGWQPVEVREGGPIPVPGTPPLPSSRYMPSALASITPPRRAFLNHLLLLGPHQSCTCGPYNTRHPVLANTDFLPPSLG